MPQLLRRIKRRNWDRAAVRPWLDSGDIPADPLGDVVTTGNNLSVYIVKDDQENLNRIIAALAATRGRPQNFDYLLFDATILSACRIEWQESEGATLDTAVNGCHRDLVCLSGSKLVELVERILNSDYVTKRVLPKQLLASVTNAVDSGYLSWEGLPETFRSKIAGNLADRSDPSG